MDRLSVAARRTLSDRHNRIARLDGIVDSPIALHKTKVVEVGERKVRVQLPGGAPSKWLGTQGENGHQKKELNAVHLLK